MAELDLRASGEHRYDVTVTSEAGERAYRLVVPPSYLESLDTHRDEATVVRAAAQLLEEAGARVPEEISLDQAESVAPGFDGQLRAVVRS